jgi:hypothetical protein
LGAEDLVPFIDDGRDVQVFVGIDAAASWPTSDAPWSVSLSSSASYTASASKPQKR